MKMKELKMYEAPKMEVVDVELEYQLMATSMIMPGDGTGRNVKGVSDDYYED